MSAEDILLAEIKKRPLVTTKELQDSLKYNMNQYKIYPRLLELERNGLIGSYSHDGTTGWLISTKGKDQLVVPNMSESAGIVLFNPIANKVFLAHPTGQTYWDIPKGAIDESETHDSRKTAVRELEEETGFVLDYTELGRREYLPAKVNDYKIIHLYRYYITPEDFLQMQSPVCRSYFEDMDGEMLPEMDAFAWVKRRHLSHYLPPFLVSNVLAAVMYSWN